MAGIGFVLRRLTARDDLSGATQAYAAAAAVTAGPWLLTILAITATEFWGRLSTMPWEHETFRIVLSYAFCFSLVLTAPVATIATRIAADRIFAHRADALGGLFLETLALALALQAPLVTAFWLLGPDLPWPVRLAAIACHCALAGLWVATAFLSVLRDFAVVLAAFVVGMGAAVAAAVWLARPLGAAGLLGAFALGAACVLAIGGARLLVEFPFARPGRRALLREAWGYRSLGLFGLVAAAAPWADKWVLWFGPESERLPSGLVNYPAYDSAMFLAYLAMIPGGALFFVALETDFFLAYRRFFDELLHGAPLARIEAGRRDLIARIARAGIALVVLQAIVTAVALLASPALVEAGVLTAAQYPIFRFGLLGAMFHTLLGALLAILSYLDVRRTQLVVAFVFLAANAGAALAFAPFGTAVQGYGYVMASMVALLVAAILGAGHFRELVYLVFIINNPSVRGQVRPLPAETRA